MTLPFGLQAIDCIMVPLLAAVQTEGALTSSLPDLEVEDESSSDASLLLRAVAWECLTALGSSSRLDGRPVVSALAVLAAAWLQHSAHNCKRHECLLAL